MNEENKEVALDPCAMEHDAKDHTDAFKADIGRDDVEKKMKIDMIYSYLKSCAREFEEASETSQGDSHTTPDPSPLIANQESVRREEYAFGIPEDMMERPTQNKFWRDGEEVLTDNAPDGLSTDFRVRLVYLNIEETLNRFTSCVDIDKNIPTRRSLKDFQRALKYARDTAATETWSTVKPTTRAMRLMSNMKNLALAIDTSRGPRQLIVNQMDPLTCCVPIERLEKLCRFCGFTEYNNKYETLGCRFYIPIKLLFLGNLVIKQFDQDRNDNRGEEEQGECTFYSLQISSYFGSYFCEFLENLYDVCFAMLNTELGQHKKNKNRHKDPTTGRVSKPPSSSSSSSLMALSSHSSHMTVTDVLDGLDEFIRRDNFKTLGTSGRKNRDSRLRYVRYDKATATLVEDEPVEDADAVFVSSYISIRVNCGGEVRMDIYARHALQLELYNDEDDNN